MYRYRYLCNKNWFYKYQRALLISKSHLKNNESVKEQFKTIQFPKYVHIIYKTQYIHFYLTLYLHACIVHEGFIVKINLLDGLIFRVFFNSFYLFEFMFLE